MKAQYDPKHFWRILFMRTASSFPVAVPRALMLLVFGLPSGILAYYDIYPTDYSFVNVYDPLTFLAAAIFTLRLKSTYYKVQTDLTPLPPTHSSVSASLELKALMRTPEHTITTPHTPRSHRHVQIRSHARKLRTCTVADETRS